jgi:molybdate transport system substrate-binding protein
VRAAAAAATGLALCGCGGGEAGGGSKPRLVVSAAASMSEALRDCSPGFAGAAVRLSFGGSDVLAAQIRRGVRPDVFAAANTKLPHALQGEGRLGRPLQFATNELVLAVGGGSGVRSLEAAAEPGVKLAIGSESVPVGSYTRELLGRLPRSERRAILANVRSKEPDVKGVIGKLTQGAVDAAFVYRSDARAAAGRLRAIRLAARLRPRVIYAAGVVKGAAQPALGRRYLRGLASGRCARALRRAGFGPPLR